MFLESFNLGIHSSVFFFLFFFLKVIAILWFFFFPQHDSKPSAPIRISGLTCFHALAAPARSLPTGSALPASFSLKSTMRAPPPPLLQQNMAPKVPAEARLAFCRVATSHYSHHPPTPPPSLQLPAELLSSVVQWWHISPQSQALDKMVPLCLPSPFAL